MIDNLTQLKEKCALFEKPINEIIVEQPNHQSTKTNLHFIVNWASSQNASESIDFLINCLQSIECDPKNTLIDTIHIYQNKESYNLKHPVGFRKIGVYH